MNTERRQVAADLWSKPTGLSRRPTYRQPVNRMHNRHLLSLPVLSPKADTHFTVQRRIGGWVDLGGCYIPHWFIRLWKLKLEVKRYSSSRQVIPELRGVTCRMWSHGVTYHPTQVISPPNPSQTGWYSIYLPQRDGRLSWPMWLVTYWDGLHARRRSPIQVLTGPGVE